MGTIKRTLISLAAVFSFMLPLAAPAVVYADQANSSITGRVCDVNQNGNINNPVQNLGNPSSTTCNVENEDTTVNNLITKIVNILSIIVGLVAVIMIIVGGFKYITSGGNTEKVTGAKNTILYGVIGLVIVALAQVIVRFVLQKTSQSA